MLKRRTINALLLTVPMSLPFRVRAENTEAELSPNELVMKVTGDVLDAIAEDNTKIDKVVDEKILPYTEFATMTRMAVGPAWRKASSKEKEEIQTLFRRLLVGVYSGALKEAAGFSAELRQNKTPSTGKTLIVRTTLTAGGREPVLLDYRLMDKDGYWKIFDVNIAGVWLVENYRSQFSSVISNKGIKGLIEQLKERVDALEKKK